MSSLDQSLVAEIRWQALSLLDQKRPEEIALVILRRTMQASSVDVSEAQLLRELDYLKDKRMVEAVDLRWKLTAYGLEVLEGIEEQPAGVTLNHVVSVSVRLRRQEIRWRMLSLLDAGRPIGISRGLMLRALEDARLLVLDNEFDQESSYLVEKGFAKVESEYLLAITASGVDLVEYTTDAPASVGRPPNRIGGQ